MNAQTTTGQEKGTLRERLGAGADTRRGSLELAKRRRARLRAELHRVNAELHRATELDRWGMKSGA